MICPLAAAYGVLRHLSLSPPAVPHPPDTGACDPENACGECEMAFAVWDEEEAKRDE